MATSSLTQPFAPWPIHTPRRSPQLLTWLPVALFLGIFAVESSKWLGADHTSSPLHAFFHLLLGKSIDQHWTEIHHLIRKSGHFLGYGFFSLFCFRGLFLSRHKLPNITTLFTRTLPCHCASIAVTFLIASMDEIHQAFLPNRTSTFSDVLLDTLGAILLQSLLFLTLAARAKTRANSPGANSLTCELVNPQGANSLTC